MLVKMKVGKSSDMQTARRSGARDHSSITQITMDHFQDNSPGVSVDLSLTCNNSTCQVSN